MSLLTLLLGKTAVGAVLSIAISAVSLAVGVVVFGASIAQPWLLCVRRSARALLLIASTTREMLPLDLAIQREHFVVLILNLHDLFITSLWYRYSFTV